MCMNQKSKADSGLKKTLIELKREIDESESYLRGICDNKELDM